MYNFYLIRFFQRTIILQRYLVTVVPINLDRCVYTVIRGVGRVTGGFTRKARDWPLIRPILNDVSLRHKKPGNVIWAERAAYTTETKLLDFSKWKITNSLAYSLSDDMMAVIYMPRSLAYMLRRWTFIFIFIIRRLKLLQYTQSFGYLEDLNVECWCALLFPFPN